MFRSRNMYIRSMLPAGVALILSWTLSAGDGLLDGRASRGSRSVQWACPASVLVIFPARAAKRRRDRGLRHRCPASGPPALQTATAARAPQWQSLFDGSTLQGWKLTQFGGEGEVHVQDGAVQLGFGYSLTGITYQNQFPTMDYEVSLDAMRVDGIDFFCGLTFPVADSHCSFIVGGWAGAVVGLSSIDGRDASENDTTRYMNFNNGQWYRIRVRVTQTKIEAWIDDQQVVDQLTTGRRVSTRNEVDLSKPFGISAWETKAALRNIRLRRLAPQPNAQGIANPSS